LYAAAVQSVPGILRSRWEFRLDNCIEGSTAFPPMGPPVVSFGVRIVLDTAALIAALRSSLGAAAEVVRLVLRQEIAILMDYKMALEYRDVALRPEHLAASGRSRENVLGLIEALEEVAEPVKVVRKVRPLSSDPNDDMVLDVAINAEADAIVTNNTKHFAAAARNFGIPVISPSDLLRRIRKGDPDAD
jgi:putative PIN family toxin of toxin-antitoxin system